jgi:hypothetical protein
MARDYLKLAYWMAPSSARLDELVERSANDAARLSQIHQLVRQSWGTCLVYEKIVGPNPRTIMLGFSMLAGSPLWYFLGEAVLLNAVLTASVVHHNRVGRRLVAELA